MPSDQIARPAEAPVPARGSGAVLLTAGGLAAAFAAAACCGLPLMLATFGLGTAWLYGIAVLAAPNRIFLLAAASACLAGGTFLLWRQSRVASACAPGSVCMKPAIRGLTVVGLLTGLGLLYLGYAYA